MKNNFAVFILSFGRAKNVLTYQMLRKQNYKGKIYIVCSTDDKQLPLYQETYPDEVIIFDKEDYQGQFDIADNFDDKRVVVYARNAVFDLAEKLGIEFFIVLDDDYMAIKYTQSDKGQYLTKNQKVKNLDRLFDSLLKFYKKNPQLKTLAIAQGGDFIGGENGGNFKKQILRKAMNFFLCSTKRRFNFVGRINEDVNTYVKYGEMGDIFMTVCFLRLEQLNTQSNEGGLTDIYLDQGTYIKSFYSVLFSPSCVKIILMGQKFRRLHHQIKWNNAVPKIISESLKK